MRRTLLALAAAFALTAALSAQNPPAPAPPGSRPAPPPGAQGGRRAVQVMTLHTTAWPDGGTIPTKHTQAGVEASPAFAWSGAPDGIVSYVLIAHDLDAAIGSGTDDVLHWMVWNIPGTATSLPEGVPQGMALADGSRQISVSGPYYRGPGAPASGPAHHYVFELYALDVTVDVPATGQSPAETRARVVEAMAGHVRAKAVYTGTFKR